MGAVIDDLSSVLGRLRQEDLSGVTPDRLAEGVVDLRRLVDGLELEWTRRVALLEEAGISGKEGYPSMTSFLKDRCRMSGTRARRAVAVSDRLDRLPFVGKAFESEDLSLDQVMVFTCLPERLSEQLASDEVMLVNTAAPLTVADTRRLVDYWRTAVDGPGADATIEEVEEQRYLFCSQTMGGMVKLDGLFDPAIGELIRTALQAATPAPCRDERRTSRQRRADALADLARSFLDSGKAPGTEKPHVLVLTDLESLQGHSGDIHETGDGHVLTPTDIRRYACDCSLSRVVFGPDSQPLDIGRTSRVVPAFMRRALIARDRHCQHPGCDRPHRWCDAHHIRHWADGGPTSLPNLKLLCRYHHTLAHRTTRPPPGG